MKYLNKVISNFFRNRFVSRKPAHASYKSYIIEGNYKLEAEQFIKDGGKVSINAIEDAEVKEIIFSNETPQIKFNGIFTIKNFEKYFKSGELYYPLKLIQAEIDMNNSQEVSYNACTVN